MEKALLHLDSYINRSSERRPAKLGVSVVVPSYMSCETLGETLSSLAAQTLDNDLFEIVLVLNGQDDGSLELVENFARSNEELNLRYVLSAQPGAGRARNVGLSMVRFEYVTGPDPRLVDT